jgi:hypothetical protein
MSIRETGNTNRNRDGRIQKQTYDNMNEEVENFHRHKVIKTNKKRKS